MADTRHWELEPYFDVDGTRAVALEDVEYVNYIEHPGPPVEVKVEKHGYDVQWMNPATGESLEQKKYSGEHFTGEAPDASHPWVLYIAREGHKESMLKSYKFESRPVPVQEIETDVKKIPFEIVAPSGNTIEAGKPAQFSVKLTRENRATRVDDVPLDRRSGGRRPRFPRVGHRDRPGRSWFRRRSPPIFPRFSAFT